MLEQRDVTQRRVDVQKCGNTRHALATAARKRTRRRVKERCIEIFEHKFEYLSENEAIHKSRFKLFIRNFCLGF